MEIKPIGYMKTSFPTKFGLPRQSGICKSLSATLVFEPEYKQVVNKILFDVVLDMTEKKIFLV